MRYINTSGYNPKKLKKESQKKFMEISACATIAEKKLYLDIASNQIWTRHKIAFEKLSHNKCWFTEAYAAISDFQIEHFRPKKIIYLISTKDVYEEERSATDKNGYWWLSYEVENLRLAGAKPNGYKGNYFPLEAGSTVATACNSSWKKEKNMFLDPCVKEDVELITYDGVEPTEASSDITSIEHIRARISINIYGLKINKLKKARSRVFEVAKNYFISAQLNWSAMEIYKVDNVTAYNLAKQNFDINCTNLVFLLRPDKQFTRMVLAFLVASNKDWIDKYVLEIATNNKFI